MQVVGRHLSSCTCFCPALANAGLTQRPGKRKAKGMQGVASFKERIVGWWSWARSVSMPGEPVANARLIPKLVGKADPKATEMQK